MNPLDSEQVARLLVEIGRRMELGGESPFKVRAYYTAAENLRELTVPLADIVAKGKLREIPGVGEAIAEKVIKLHKTGTHPTLEFLREQLPATVLELMELPGLGPKKVLALVNDAGIRSLDELEAACQANKLAAVKGIGPNLQSKLVKALEFRRKGAGLLLLDAAERQMQTALRQLAVAYPELETPCAVGPLRRACEVIPSLEILGVAADPSVVPAGAAVNDVPVRAVPKEFFGLALVESSGSGDHLAALKERAQTLGISWTARGLLKGSKPLPVATEADVYAALELPLIPAELRETGAEVELAARGALPALVSEPDIRGILHSHTDFSDGTETLETMAREVQRRGWQYYGVTDHSQSAGYAGGLKEPRVREQQALADELNAVLGRENFRIFKGIESDILQDGALDYPDSVLASFDFIVASIHSRFELDRDAQTARMLAAIANPRTTILGHMTGRLLLQREGYALDVEEILKACARHGVVIEINANPYRLDIDWRWHRRAVELGVMLAITPDAHSIGDLDFMRYGVAHARKGLVPKEKILNTMSTREISQFFESRKKQPVPL